MLLLLLLCAHAAAAAVCACCCCCARMLLLCAPKCAHAAAAVRAANGSWRARAGVRARMPHLRRGGGSLLRRLEDGALGHPRGDEHRCRACAPGRSGPALSGRGWRHRCGPPPSLPPPARPRPSQHGRGPSKRG
eukprot:3279728-Prymnesium_polylepis.1